MRHTFVVGDVHGCDIALEKLLDAMILTSEDRLIMLGDVIDRGSDSRRVIEMLIDIGNSCRLDFVMGNHEQMLLDALRSPSVATIWSGWGGAETLAAYGEDLADIPADHLAFLAAGLPYVETDRYICIHANLEPDVPLESQSADWLRWHKVTGSERPHESGKRIVCGHTRLPGDVPRVTEGWIMIDTCAYDGGFLTAVELTTGEILQARQTGEFRRGVYLDEL